MNPIEECRQEVNRITDNARDCMLSVINGRSAAAILASLDVLNDVLRRVLAAYEEVSSFAATNDDERKRKAACLLLLAEKEAMYTNTMSTLKQTTHEHTDSLAVVWRGFRAAAGAFGAYMPAALPDVATVEEVLPALLAASREAHRRNEEEEGRGCAGFKIEISIDDCAIRVTFGSGRTASSLWIPLVDGLREPTLSIGLYEMDDAPGAHESARLRWEAASSSMKG